MAWDFETEPEFQEQLDWTREFLDEHILPLEPIELEVTDEQWKTLTAPLKQQVKDRGLWACHLDPELGGQGFGQVKLGLMHEILGRSSIAPAIFGNNAPDSGNAELLAIGGNEEQKKKWMEPLLAGELRSGFSMTEPDTAGSDPTLLETNAVRDGDTWVINGHKWFTSGGSGADFLIAMVVTNPDVHPYQGSSMIVVPTDTPGLEIVRDVPNMHHPYPGQFARHPLGHSEVIYQRRAGAGREPDRRARRRVCAGPETPRPRSHPPRHALDRPIAAGAGHDVRAGAVPIRPRQPAG